jgi:adenylate cyclase
MQLNPAHPDWYSTNLGLALYSQGRYQEAISAYATVAAPQIGILAGLAASYAQLGDMGRAAASKKRLLDLAPDFSAQRFVGFKPFLHKRDCAHLLDGLKKAGLPL